jgi:adenylate cyclase
VSNAAHQTKSGEAYDLYLKGLYHKGKVSRDTLEKAIGFFKQAIALDPALAAPHAGLSHSYIALGYSSQVPPKEAYPQALSELQKALAMDDQLADAHADAAIVRLIFDWDWPGAKKEFDRAIELDPASGLAHHWYSHYFVMMNRFDASLAESRRALELEPVDLPISAHIGWHYLFARQYGRAVTELLKSIELEPNQFWAWPYQRRAYEQQGDFERAIAVLERSKADSKHVADLRREVAKNGAQGYSRTRLADALAQSQKHYLQPCYIAQLLVHLGDSNGAFEFMNRGYEVRDSWLIYLKVDPVWDPLRSDPRFADLINKVGIP